MKTLLNDFKGFDLKTRLLKMQHHLEEATITTEASIMDMDYDVDLGVGIGHAVNLFMQEEEAEVLLSPITKLYLSTASRFNIQRQKIIQQHSSSPVVSIKQQQQLQ
jgi:hypothetical protein